jgi:hypothetical protein
VGAGAERKGGHGGGGMTARDRDGGTGSAGGGRRLGWATWAKKAK